MPDVDPVASATDRLEKEWKRHRARVKAARTRLKEAERDHSASVREAQRRLAEVSAIPRLAGNPYGAGELAKVAVYEDHIHLADGDRPLDADVTASVETAGNLMVTRRHTLTRSILLGRFSAFAPKATTHGVNELYLVLEAETWAAVVPCEPRSGLQARKLAQRINLAARAAPEAARRRRELIGLARRELAALRTDRPVIEQARIGLGKVAAQGRATIGPAFHDLERELAAAGEGRPSRRAAKRCARIRADDQALADEIEAELARTAAPLEPAPVVAVEPGEHHLPSAERPHEVGADWADDDPVDLLSRLATLRDAHVLTDAEFEAKKAEILRRL